MALDPAAPTIASVYHPTDLSGESAMAFAHALRIALAAQGELAIVHAIPSDDATIDWKHFPGVRDTLQRWGFVPDGAGREAVDQLGLRVEKIQARGRQPLDALAEWLRERPPQLVAVGGHARLGAGRWMRRRVAEPLARSTGAMTLHLRNGARGFVNPEDGSVDLGRVLIPVQHASQTKPAVQAAASLAHTLGAEKVDFGLCLLGDARGMPPVAAPQQPGWTWRRVTPQRRGVGRALSEAAAAFQPNLIVMASPTGRALRRAPCAVLTLPPEAAEAG